MRALINPLVRGERSEENLKLCRPICATQSASGWQLCFLVCGCYVWRWCRERACSTGGFTQKPTRRAGFITQRTQARNTRGTWEMTAQKPTARHTAERQRVAGIVEITGTHRRLGTRGSSIRPLTNSLICMSGWIICPKTSLSHCICAAQPPWTWAHTSRNNIYGYFNSVRRQQLYHAEPTFPEGVGPRRHCDNVSWWLQCKLFIHKYNSLTRYCAYINKTYLTTTTTQRRSHRLCYTLCKSGANSHVKCRDHSTRFNPSPHKYIYNAKMRKHLSTPPRLPTGQRSVSRTATTTTTERANRRRTATTLRHNQADLTHSNAQSRSIVLASSRQIIHPINFSIYKSCLLILEHFQTDLDRTV